jgi:E3 ubiquitin-protein ligase RNF139
VLIFLPFFFLMLLPGLTGMEEGKRLVRLFRNLCLLSTAILHFFHSMLHPLLMNASASRSTNVAQVFSECGVQLFLLLCNK